MFLEHGLAKTFKLKFFSGISENSFSVKTAFTGNAIPQGGRGTCRDLKRKMGGGGEANENRFTTSTDVVQMWYCSHYGEADNEMDRCDHGNGGKESISLTSDGTVADGRGEGHHFNVGGVKQARDISSSSFSANKLIEMILLQSLCVQCR